MTEKRYYTDGQYVMQHGEVYVICNGKHNADVVATALNELLDKNEELKELGDYFERKKYEYHNKWNLAHLDNINLRKENKELKEENEKLKGEVKRLKCINKQLEDRLGRDIALNMDCVEAIEDWENECKRCYGSK